MRSITRSNSGCSASHSGSSWAIAANGRLKKLKRPVGVELRGAGGHPVGELALRFDVTGKLGARVLEILDVDREAGDRAGRQRHVDDPQHAPLAADDRRLHARDDAAASPAPRARVATALSSPSASISSAPRSMTSAASRALDRADERAVDQAELEVRAAIPHREWRRLDQLGQRIERGFGLAKPKRQLGPLLLGRADVEEPQQQRPGRLARRRTRRAHRTCGRRRLTHPAGHRRSRQPAQFRVQLGVARGLLASIRQPLRSAPQCGGRLSRPRPAQVAVGFDPAVSVHHERPRRSRPEQA